MHDSKTSGLGRGKPRERRIFIPPLSAGGSSGWNSVGTNCGICFANCPYAQEDEATLHTILKATTSSTTLFNGVIKSASDMVYPQEFDGNPIKDPEEWWHNTNLPEYGINTMQGERKL